MPFKKGDKPGPGRPRKASRDNYRRLAQDTAANAIEVLHSAITELSDGHPTIRCGLASDSILRAINILHAIHTGQPPRPGEPGAAEQYAREQARGAQR
jgi:hypothetical protein